MMVRMFIKCIAYVCAVVCLHCVFTEQASSQSPSTQKPDDIFSGEGTGKTAEEARESALRVLVTQIQTNISSTTEGTKVEVDSIVSSTHSQSFHVSTRLKLQGVRFEIRQGNGIYTAVASISRDDLAQSIKIVKNELLNDFQTALAIVKAQGVENALSLLYKIYLRTYYCPESVEYQTLDGTISLRTYIETMLKGYLREVQIDQGVAGTTPTEERMYPVDFSVRYRNRPVDDIVLQFSAIESGERRVQKGTVTISIEETPVSLKVPMTVLVSFFLNPKSTESELLELHAQFGLKEERNVVIDYTRRINCDFEITKRTDTVYSFSPKIAHLGVNTIAWDFGDGTVSNATSPVKVFSSGGDHVVTMTINSSQDFTVKKMLSGKIIDTLTLPPQQDLRQPDVAFSSASISLLLQQPRFPDLQAVLQQLKKEGKILYGKKNDFSDPKNCYIFLVNKDNETIVSVLAPGTDPRTNLLSTQTKGGASIATERTTPVWVQIIERK